jgi:hypothetical protein
VVEILKERPTVPEDGKAEIRSEEGQADCAHAAMKIQHGIVPPALIAHSKPRHRCQLNTSTGKP